MPMHALINSRARFSRALFSLGIILFLSVSARAESYQMLVARDPLNNARSYVLSRSISTGNVSAPQPGATSFWWLGNTGSIDEEVFVFSLPVLGAGETIDDASFRFNAVSGGVLFNVDLYAIGINDSGAPLAEFLDSDVPDAGNVRLQDNLLTPLSTAEANPVRTTDAAGGAALATYLNTFYSDNPGYAGGSFVYLRLNPDGAEAISDSGLWRIFLHANSGPNGFDDPFQPVLSFTTVPEPATWALAAMGVVALLAIKRRNALRFSRTLLVFGLILFSCVSARETVAEIIAKVDSLPPAWTENRLVGLGPTISRIDQLLESPVGGEIVGVQVFWESLTGTAAPVQQPAIRVSSRSGQTGLPDTTLATINSPTLYDVGLNEFRFLDPEANLIPISVPVTAGQKFFIGLELTPSAANSPDTPGLMMDSDRIQGQNFAQISNGTWVFLTIGIFHGGDLGLRAIIQPVPEPSTYALAAIAAIGLLAINRRKAFRFSRALLVVGLILFSCASALAESYQVQIALDDSSLHIPRSYILNRHVASGTISAQSPGIRSPWYLGNDTAYVSEEVYVFSLPALGVDETIDGAGFRFTTVTSSPDLNFNVDLYAIGINNSGEPLVEFLDSDIPDAGNIKLQNDILTPPDYVVGIQPRTTDAAGGAALAAYLADFYTANPGYAGGSFLYLRLNPDSTGLGLWRVYLNPENFDPSSTQPLLFISTVPEPSTFAMAAIGAIGLLAIKRRNAKA